MSKTFKIVGNDISDCYHTFDELYEHRCLLFITLLLVDKNCKKTWKREHFEGWDCLYMETAYGQISYHVPANMRELYEGKIKEDPTYKYDGHSSAQVIERLRDQARIL